MLVTQSCLTLCSPMDCGQWDSSVHGILQTRILQWIAIPFSRASSQPRDGTQVSCTAGRFFTIWASWEAWNYLTQRSGSQFPPAIDRAFLFDGFRSLDLPVCCRRGQRGLSSLEEMLRQKKKKKKKQIKKKKKQKERNADGGLWNLSNCIKQVRAQKVGRHLPPLEEKPVSPQVFAQLWVHQQCLRQTLPPAKGFLLRFSLSQQWLCDWMGPIGTQIK